MSRNNGRKRFICMKSIHKNQKKPNKYKQHILMEITTKHIMMIAETSEQRKFEIRQRTKTCNRGTKVRNTAVLSSEPT